MVEYVDLVVIEGDHNLWQGIVVEVADSYVEAIAAVTVVSGSVYVSVVTRSGGAVEAWPGIKCKPWRLI
jgi:hypothetical protein